MRVFLTGASGFVGGAVVQQLHRAGHSLRILARNPSAGRLPEMAARYHLDLCRGDILDPDSLHGPLKGVDAIVHLVGIISEVGRCTFENVHTLGTRNLVAAAKAQGVSRFVHMSALGTRPSAASRYHRTKWVAEEIVRNNGLDFTIFRPSLIYGPQDQFVNLFATLARFSPVVPLVGSATARFQPVGVEVVAAAFARCLSVRESVGKVIDLCGRETMTLPQIIDQILAVRGQRRMKVRVPAGVAKWQAAFLESVYPRFLGKAPPLNRDQLIMLQEDNVGDPCPAETLLGLDQRPFREGIAAYLA